MQHIGFYGKTPFVGDFLHRRLPTSFIGPWDRWVQSILQSAQSALGEEWQTQYKATPPWRFVMEPGCIDAHGWIGLMIPSVDRVGRYFPLTLASHHDGSLDTMATLLAAEVWLQILEDRAFNVFDPAIALTEWDASLIPLPPPPVIALRRREDDTMPLRLSAAPLARVISPPVDALRVAAATEDFRGPTCLFSCRSSHSLAVSEGLPDARLSTALFDGNWELHGWTMVSAAAISPVHDVDAADQTRPFLR